MIVSHVNGIEVDTAGREVSWLESGLATKTGQMAVESEGTVLAINRQAAVVQVVSKCSGYL